MVLLRLAAGSCMMLLLSCAGARQVNGVYQSPETGSQLVLRSDSSFEWIYPGSQETEIGTGQNYRNLLYFTGGTWSISKSRLVLIPSSDKESFSTEMADDSISRFTSISSINFWNRYGEQVKIRAIRLPRAELKPHFGNSLYFFAQDFHRRDTLVFYLEGYRPFVYPGTIPGSIGDNIHKITLYEPYHKTDQTIIRIKGKRLYANRQYYVKKS
ncbi:MAG: hypothetical protein DI535_17355 [Citrobacter freundii]|nr:MAG: hypothetical protein DI535_17355 [Citrobacter freundii]